TIGLVIPDMDDSELKRQSYGCDITYGTNNEFGFDYLRDNMAPARQYMVQRGHNFAIVDEVDSILIDEARTPLIISGPVDDAAVLYTQFARIVTPLQAERDYEVDEKKKTVAPTEEGITRVEEALGVENLYDNINQNFVHQLQAALRAKELFKRDVDYVVQDGEVKIVDEFTGRILEGRRWSEGLHQAVLNAKQHEKEALIVTQAGRIGSVTVATNMAGRGVDILLGGNPEGLAEQELMREGSSKAEAPERYEELLARFKPECQSE